MIPDYPKISVLAKWQPFTLKDAYETRDSDPIYSWSNI